MRRRPPVKIPERFKVGITRHRPDDAEEAEQFVAWSIATFGPGWSNPAREAWYARNPCLDDDGPGPWLCRREGKIVGRQGEIPFELQVGHDLRPATWGVDLHVEEAWRLRGVGPALIATLFDRRPIVCLLDMSEDGYAAFARSGSVDLGDVPVYRRPLDPRRVPHLPGVPAKLRRFGFVLVLALWLVDALVAAAVRLSGAKLVPVERLDGRVDEVWAAVRTAYPVLARRDLAALAWRIDDRPDADHLSRYYLVRRGRPLGYVVLRPNTSSSGEPTVVVVDYLAPPRWVAPLLLLVGRVARRGGAVAMSVKTRNHRADRALRATGFVRRGFGNDLAFRFMVRCADEPQVAPEIAAQLMEADAWFLTATDSNLEHPDAGDQRTVTDAGS